MLLADSTGGGAGQEQQLEQEEEEEEEEEEEIFRIAESFRLWIGKNKFKNYFLVKIK